MNGEIPMMAKFASKCSECGYRINEKDLILYHTGTKKARHSKCPEPSYNGEEQANIFNTWIQRAEKVNNG